MRFSNKIFIWLIIISLIFIGSTLYLRHITINLENTLVTINSFNTSLDKIEIYINNTLVSEKQLNFTDNIYSLDIHTDISNFIFELDSLLIDNTKPQSIQNISLKGDEIYFDSCNDLGTSYLISLEGYGQKYNNYFFLNLTLVFKSILDPKNLY